MAPEPTDAKVRAKPVLYVIGVVALVLVAAVAMAAGGRLLNLGPWSGDSQGHGTGPMEHGPGGPVTCEGDRHGGGGHGSGGNRTHSSSDACHTNRTHGASHGG